MTARVAGGVPLRRTAGIAAAAVLALGLLVVAGWALDVAFLRGPIPGLIQMKFNTAVAFASMGAALLLVGGRGVAPGRRRLALALAAAAALIGGLSLLEYLLDRNLGIDELTFDDAPGAAMTVDPGRLAPQSAVNFLLLGVAVLVMDAPHRRLRELAEVLVLLPMAIAAFAVIGYAYGAGSFTGVAAFSPIALHTAIGFLVLGVAIVSSRPDRGLAGILVGDTAGGMIARRLLPVVAVALPALGWLRLVGERHGFYDHGTGVALLVLAFMLILVVGIAATAHSFNRLEAARREAAEERQKLAAIVESSEDAIIGKDLDGTIMSWNAGAERLYGHSSAEAVGNSISLIIPPERAGEAEQILAAVARGEQVVHSDTIRRRQDGTLAEVSVAVSPIRDTTGRIVGAASIAHDITGRRLAEEATRRAREEAEVAREEAEHANAAKSEFLSRMSHELRTPLSAVLGFGELLEMGQLDERQRYAIVQILKGGRHLLDLIDELLDISRIEAGELSISIEPVRVREVIEEAVALAQPLGSKREISVEASLDGYGDLFVAADLQRLKQVLLNLLSNAIKYNREGGRVTASVRREREHLRIAVTDTGPGIDAAEQELLFQPFERLGAEAGEIQGTGLGLALSKGLVTAMGGVIGVESEPGAGSTFFVELAEAEAGSESTRSASTSLTNGNSASPAEHSGQVLYIEDKFANLNLVESALAQHRPGTTVLTAMQGALGLELALEHRPDLVLLDLHLPDMSGERVLKLLRSDERTRLLPVVVLSADATPQTIKRVLTGGADEYLTKPLQVRRFIEVIDRVIRTPVGAPVT